jgi:hypothetical protein
MIEFVPISVCTLLLFFLGFVLIAMSTFKLVKGAFHGESIVSVLFYATIFAFGCMYVVTAFVRLLVLKV